MKIYSYMKNQINRQLPATLMKYSIGSIKGFLCLILMAVLFLMTQPALAQIFDDVDKGFLSIGGRATYFDPKGVDGNWFGGAQVRVHLLPVFAVEGSTDYRTTDFASSSREDYFPVQVSGLLYLLPGKRLSPFILGGGGWYYSHIARENADDDTDKRFAPHVGGGIQLMVTDDLSVDGSYRYILFDDRAGGSKERTFGDQFSDKSHMVTIGINLHF